MTVADPLMDDDFCDPACELEKCLTEKLPPNWQSVGCKGSVSVGIFVGETAPATDKATLRCGGGVHAAVTVRIETQVCDTPDCAAGRVEQTLKHLFGVGCKACCVSMQWIDTIRSIDEHKNKETRVMRFEASTHYKKRDK